MVKKTANSFLLIIAVFILINLLIRGPDLLGYLCRPADKWYTGQVSWFDPWDLNLYSSVIGWGKRDGVLLENLYDTQSNQRLPIYFFYTLLGKIALIFKLSNSFAFHLAGLVLSFWLVGVTWWLVGIFLKEERERKIAFLLLFLSGGLGWLFLPKIILPDIGQPNFTLIEEARTPHVALSVSLFLLTVGGFWKGIVDRRKDYLFLAALSSFLMIFFHPYSLVPLGLILLYFSWGKEKESARFLQALVLLGVEFGIYYLLVGKDLLFNPGFSGVVSQVLPSPSPLKVILGWGVLFPLIIISLFSKEKEKETLFLKIWFISHWLVIYLPFGFQQLLTRGLRVPVALLAVKGVKEVSQKTTWNYRLIAGLLLILASFSSFFITYKRITGFRQDRWSYLTREEGEVIDYLKTHGENEEGVLASYRIVNIIPAHTAKRVWAGHTFQSPDFEKRKAEVYRFFRGEMEESEARLFLEKTKTAWVFWGPEEREIAGSSVIPVKNLLEPVITNEVASLYRVRE